MNIVAHNMLAMNAQRQFGINTKSRAKSAEKLSSGYKINRASDDAAGLSISEKMRAQIRGLSQGVENTQDGVSLCQVADGALAEVNDMLHRITELSVQAANGTNTPQERQSIQREIRSLMSEIDRIGDTTEFNDQPVFKGSERIIKHSNADGSSAVIGDIPFSDFTLVDVDLGRTPLTSGSGADMLNLQAIVKNSSSSFNGDAFNLIYGNGSTSSSSFRVKAGSSGTLEYKIKMSELSQTDFAYDGTDKWTRKFSWNPGTDDELIITQTVQVDESNDDEKNYIISYDFQKGTNIKNVEFMFHADTAYNNNDRCEGYFIDGKKVENYSVYSQKDKGGQTGSELTKNATSAYVDKTKFPTSFSIIDQEKALSFSEKVSFEDDDLPNSLSIGYYYDIKDWSYYNNLDSHLGQSTTQADLGFCLYYDLKDLTKKSWFSFKYGIVKTESDSNLKNVTVKKDDSVIEEHEHLNELNLWIQSGANEGDGMYLTIGEMNTGVLGLSGTDVSTVDGASQALKTIQSAQKKVSANRSRIGAQQNRLEHTIANGNNNVENTTAAESRIRDTDMAEEMVNFSKQMILENVGQSMMAQANQSNQGVLSLLS